MLAVVKLNGDRISRGVAELIDAELEPHERHRFKLLDRVRMTAELKATFIGKCANGHVGPFDPGDGKDDPGGDCWGCSSAHVEEFGDCEGIVVAVRDYNRPDSTWSADAIDVDVRWQPSNLLYGYLEKFLEPA